MDFTTSKVVADRHICHVELLGNLLHRPRAAPRASPRGQEVYTSGTNLRGRFFDPPDSCYDPPTGGPELIALDDDALALIALAKAGERNPDVLCDRALEDICRP